MKTLARECFAGLDASEREAVIQFFASGLTESSDQSLHIELASLREMLRERLPGSGPPGATRQCIYVDALHLLGDRSFWIRGWLFDGESPATRLRLVSPEGVYVELFPSAFRYPREHLAELFGVAADDDHVQRGSFSAFFELKTPSGYADGWIAELHSALANPVESPVPTTSEYGAEQAIMKMLAYPTEEGLFERHVRPALDRLRKSQNATLQIRTVSEYGGTPKAPVASILVPLLDDTDLIEYQLALLSNDAELLDSDLVYVTHSNAIIAKAEQLSRLYPVPFRIVVLNQRASRADAMNIAATSARGQWVVLFGPTVFPDRPGWLGAMIRCNAKTPQIGNCLLVEREKYLSAGGLDRQYLTTEFGIADLRRKLTGAAAEQGRPNGATLYHLDKLTVSETMTANARGYDAWLYEHIWGETLKA